MREQAEPLKSAAHDVILLCLYVLLLFAEPRTECCGAWWRDVVVCVWRLAEDVSHAYIEILTGGSVSDE